MSRGAGRCSLAPHSRPNHTHDAHSPATQRHTRAPESLLRSSGAVGLRAPPGRARPARGRAAPSGKPTQAKRRHEQCTRRMQAEALEPDARAPTRAGQLPVPRAGSACRSGLRPAEQGPRVVSATLNLRPARCCSHSPRTNPLSARNCGETPSPAPLERPLPHTLAVASSRGPPWPARRARSPSWPAKALAASQPSRVASRAACWRPAACRGASGASCVHPARQSGALARQVRCAMRSQKMPPMLRATARLEIDCRRTGRLRPRRASRAHHQLRPTQRWPKLIPAGRAASPKGSCRVPTRSPARFAQKTRSRALAPSPAVQATLASRQLRTAWQGPGLTMKRRRMTMIFSSGWLLLRTSTTRRGNQPPRRKKNSLDSRPSTARSRPSTTRRGNQPPRRKKNSLDSRPTTKRASLDSRPSTAPRGARSSCSAPSCSSRFRPWSFATWPFTWSTCYGCCCSASRAGA